MTPQELKESILWNAIQGKLTRQDPRENTAEVIGGIALSEVAEEEKYFDIPDNWRWCKIGDIFDLVNGKAFKPSDWSPEGLPIVRIQNLNDPKAPFNYCSETVEDKFILNGGELLFSWSGTPGTSFGAFIWNGGKAALNQHIFIVYPRINADIKYLRYALNGEIKVFIDKAHGGAGLKHITKKEFENSLLPLPPLAEQKRIVAKIEELLPYIDRYEQAWSKLEDFNKRFPVDMQKSILQMAIQGKLVEQRPEEGTGEELYQQIQQEKQKLIKAGKIKKEKPLPEISEDEKPFEIPESWKWVRLLEIIYEKPTNGYSPKGVDYETKVRNLTLTATTSGKFKKDAFKYVDIQLEDDSKYWLRYDDLLIQRSNSRELVGTSCIFTGKDKTYIYPDLMMRMRVVEGVSVNYIDYVLKSPMVREYFMSKASGTSESMPKINQGIVSNTVIPLPPLAEQKRIVAKLEEILPLCERLK